MRSLAIAVTIVCSAIPNQASASLIGVVGSEGNNGRFPALSINLEIIAGVVKPGIAGPAIDSASDQEWAPHLFRISHVRDLIADVERLRVGEGPILAGNDREQFAVVPNVSLRVPAFLPYLASPINFALIDNILEDMEIHSRFMTVVGKMGFYSFVSKIRNFNIVSYDPWTLFRPKFRKLVLGNYQGENNGSNADEAYPKHQPVVDVSIRLFFSIFLGGSYLLAATMAAARHRIRKPFQAAALGIIGAGLLGGAFWMLGEAILLLALR